MRDTQTHTTRIVAMLCHSNIRPEVVWFGEMLPEDAWERAELIARNCEVLLCIGTSSVVWPAAQLPIDAKRCGAVVVQINPDATPLDNNAHYNLRGNAGNILPLLLEALKQ